MMLEQSLISPNFLGKESFRWFIGVVTKYAKSQDISVGGGYKAKVRIIGYHPDSSKVIKEEELPWAHVLVPLSMGSGTGGQACYNIPAGGETVIGFFLDGDNAQQPVIIGALFAGYNIEHTNSWEQGTDGFKPFKPQTYPLSISNINSTTKKASDSKTGAPTVPSSTGKVPSSDGDKCSAANLITNNTDIVTIPPECKSSTSTYSKILQVLRSLIKGLNTINQVTSIITNAATAIQTLVDDAITALSDLFSVFIKEIRDKVIKAINDWFSENVLSKLFGKDAKLLEELAKDKVIDGIWCAFRKILNELVKFIGDFLNEIVNEIVSFPFCAIEALVGSVMSSISNQISDELSSVLGEFTDVVGSISSYVSQALGYANTALQFLSCESAECKEALNYEMNTGYISNSTMDDINNALAAPSQGIKDAKEAAADWLGITNGSGSSSLGSCDVTSLECGLPTVEIFGGGGIDAAGFAVVDAVGQVIGVNLTDSGSGYTSAPYVSIEDSCGNGTGAQATAVIDENGQVSQIIMDSVGIGYLNATNVVQESAIASSGTTTTIDGTTTTIDGVTTTITTTITTTANVAATVDPSSINPIDSSGSEVVGSIVDVAIVRPGVGYSSSDVITNANYNSDVEIYPVVDDLGRITGVNVVNPGTAIRVFPELAINTENGEGAILQPVLSFKPVEEVGIETNQSKIKKVVLCAEDHGL